MSDFTRRTATKLLFAGAAAALTIGFAAPAQAGNHTVTITEFAFEPAQLTVNAGDTITFINKDRAPHTATSKAGGFDTGRLKKNKSATITVSKKGTFDYLCTVHPRMKAKLVVR